jgi:hypothetical protein
MPSQMNERPSREQSMTPTLPRGAISTAVLLAALVPTLHIGVMLFAADGTLEYANDAALPLRDDVHNACAPSPLDAIVTRGLLAGETAHDVEVVCGGWLNDHGEWRPSRDVLVNATLIPSVSAEGNGLLVTLEDVTARRELERLRPMLQTLGRL